MESVREVGIIPILAELHVLISHDVGVFPLRVIVPSVHAVIHFVVLHDGLLLCALVSLVGADHESCGERLRCSCGMCVLLLHADSREEHGVLALSDVALLFDDAVGGASCEEQGRKEKKFFTHIILYIVCAKGSRWIFDVV